MGTWPFPAPTRSAGVKRALRHDEDDGVIDTRGYCQDCGALVAVPEIRIEPGPGFQPTDSEPDPVSAAMNSPRRLLEPIRSVH